MAILRSNGILEVDSIPTHTPTIEQSRIARLKDTLTFYYYDGAVWVTEDVEKDSLDFTINLKDPNGSDDSTRINDTLALLPTVDGVKGGTLILGAGVWNIGAPINLDGNNLITLRGQGSSTILQSAAGGVIFQSHKTVFTSRVNENLVVENLHFKGHATVETIGIDIKVRHNAVVRDCLFTGQTLRAIEGADLNNVQFSNNNIINVLSGYRLKSIDFDIEDVSITGGDISYVIEEAIFIDGSSTNQATGLPAQKVIISGVTIEESIGSTAAIYFKEVRFSSIIGNTVSQSTNSLIRLEDGNNTIITGNTLKEALGGNAVDLIGQISSQIIYNNIDDVVNAVTFDANSHSNSAGYNGNEPYIDLSGNNNYTRQDGGGSVRPLVHTFGGQARFEARASSNGGGFTDIHYLFESRLTNRDMAMALNAPAGRDARLYFNQDGVRGHVFHLQNSGDFDLYNGGTQVFRWKDDNDFRAYFNGEIDGNLEIGGKVNASEYDFSQVPVYADESSASSGGLLSGLAYITPTGELRVKL